MEGIRLSVVSYMNTRPFIYGLENSEIWDMLELSKDIPSVGADKIVNGEVDIGLVPVVTISRMKEPNIISDYCIGSDGKVRTVCVFSQVPIEKIRRIYLDYHSRTSVHLLRILLDEYWQLKPELIEASTGYESQMQGDTAGLVIGDRAFDHEEKFQYRYDLGEVWKQHTGLPFVFATWVSNRQFPKPFLKQFNEALKLGITNIDNSLLENEKHFLPYLHNNISFHLDDHKKKGMNLFLTKVSGLTMADQV
ncbi:MAG: menaquinone biosynthesis protein [Bacteroidetes bacterium]|nr:menaquinone biosynthesis protein [Bacteroidota bacterium]